MKHDVRFTRIFCELSRDYSYPVNAVIEAPYQFAAPDQHRKKLIKIGNMQNDGLMMRFVAVPQIYIVGVGHYDNPLMLFDGHRVSPTMKGTEDFCNAMMAHLVLMEP